MQKFIANGKEGTVRMDDQDGMILVNTSANHRGEFRWFSSVLRRSGKTFSKSRLVALKRGIKALNIKPSWVE